MSCPAYLIHVMSCHEGERGRRGSPEVIYLSYGAAVRTYEYSIPFAGCAATGENECVCEWYKVGSLRPCCFCFALFCFAHTYKAGAGDVGVLIRRPCIAIFCFC